MKSLNSTEYEKLTPVSRGTPRARARAKINRLKGGSAILFTKEDLKKFGENIRNLTWGLEGKFSVRKFKEGIAVKRTK